MPRVARIKSKSKIYHIMIRGINQQDIFSADRDYKKFITILSKHHKKNEYEIYAYCLMGHPAKCSYNYARQGFKISKRTGWLLIKAGI